MPDRDALKILYGEEPTDQLSVDNPKAGRPPERRRRHVVLTTTGIAVLLTIAGGTIWRMSMMEQVQVETFKIEAETTGENETSSLVLNASGYIVARRMATVSSNVIGRIDEIFIEEGDLVERGQALARLEDATARAQVKLSESRVHLAQAALTEIEVRLPERRRNLERLRALSSNNLISESSIDQAQGEIDTLEARLITAKKDLEVARRQVDLDKRALTDLVIKAPFKGVVVSKSAQPGEIISPMSAGDGFTRTGIGTIVDMESLEIEVDVNESYIERVRPGQPTEVVLEAYPEWRIPGRVINTVPVANRQKATVKVRVGLDTLDSRILPDMGVRVAFLQDTGETGEENSDPTENRKRVLLPETAVWEESGKKYVFVVENSRARRRQIEVGSAGEDQIEIGAGLKKGEWVVISHKGPLAEGVEVKMNRSSVK